MLKLLGVSQLQPMYVVITAADWVMDRRNAQCAWLLDTNYFWHFNASCVNRVYDVESSKILTHMSNSRLHLAHVFSSLTPWLCEKLRSFCCVEADTKTPRTFTCSWCHQLEKVMRSVQRMHTYCRIHTYIVE